MKVKVQTEITGVLWDFKNQIYMFISNTDISTNMKRRGEHTNQTKTTETTVGYIFHYQTSRGLSNIKMLT